MSNLHIVEHPLIAHKLTLIRDKTTGVKEFREAVSEIAMLLCYEATRDLPLKEIEIETPVAVTKSKVISGKKLAIVPILRAGIGMVDGILNLVPAAKVGHIGLYRDPETTRPVEYYCKLPEDIASREVIILDPMLATGGSAVTLPAWGLTLNCGKPVPADICQAGIRARHVMTVPEGTPDAFYCTVERVIQDVFTTIVLLRPEGAASGAPLLRMELERDDWRRLNRPEGLWIAIQPRDILLLK